MELNCQPSRLDLNETALAAAVKHGVKIVLGTDAHATEELRFMEFGVYQARRAGLEAANVVNTRPLPQLFELLKPRRPTRPRHGVRIAATV
jgi:DNA polymerase (family 10)